MSKFKVGDKVKWGYVVQCGNYTDHNGAYMIITEVNDDGDYYHYDIYDKDDNRTGSCYACSSGDRHNQLVKYGETAMTNEQEFTYPEFVVIVKNTELLKKGGVFRLECGIYALQNKIEEAFQARPYDTHITEEQAKFLIEKKVMVEAVKFNPAFVTLAQNEALQAALEAFNKAPKKSVKKATKKA